MAEPAEERISAEEHETRMHEVDDANAPDPGESGDYVDRTALPRNDAPSGLGEPDRESESVEHEPLPRRDG